MADHCQFCDTRRPEGGTNHLVLNGGSLWIEFCEECGENETLTNPDTGETLTVKELFDRGSDESTTIQTPEVRTMNVVSVDPDYAGLIIEQLSKEVVSLKKELDYARGDKEFHRERSCKLEDQIESLEDQIDDLQDKNWQLQSKVNLLEKRLPAATFDELRSLMTAEWVEQRPIDAIKMVRKITNCSLKEAKDFVDDIRALHKSNAIDHEAWSE